MARIIPYLLVFICSPFLQSKASSDTLHLPLQLIKTIEGKYTDFSIDNLGNIYLITAANQLKELNNNFDSIALFNESTRYGDISYIDASNPLKVLVYYKDFGTILMLDRQLSIKNTINLHELGLLQVRAIAQSYDNNIWLFDEIESKLKKIDETGNTLFETPDFRLLFDKAYNPQRIIDREGLLYLYNIREGWKIFDYYGGFVNQYPIYNWKDVQVTKGILNGHDSNLFYAFMPKGIEIRPVQYNINIANALKITQQSKLVYVLTSEGLSVYKVIGDDY